MNNPGWCETFKTLIYTWLLKTQHGLCCKSTGNNDHTNPNMADFKCGLGESEDEIL
jgi:hypothetical protein